MQQNPEVVCTHPVWVVWTARIALPILCALWIYLIVYFAFGDTNQDPILLVPVLILVGFPLYMAFVSFRVWPFLDAEIILTADHVEVRRKDQLPVTCPWNLVGEVKHYATSSVLDVYNRDGTRLFAVFEQVRNYKELTWFLDANTDSDLAGTKLYS